MGSVYLCTIQLKFCKTFEGKRIHLRVSFSLDNPGMFLFKTHSFLGPFTKLRTATVRFLMSVRHSARPLPSPLMKQLGFQRKDFREILCLDFPKILRKFKFH